MKTQRLISSIFAIASLFILYVGLHEVAEIISSSPVPKDYVVFHTAYLIAAKGLNPYDVNLLAPLQTSWYPAGYGPCPFLNPPWFLSAFALLLKHDIPSAFTTWRIISVVATIIAALLAFKPGHIRGISIAIALAVFNLPLWLALQWGQVGGILALAIMLILIGIRDDRPLISGTGLALLSVKPLSFYLVPFFVLFHFFKRSKNDAVLVTIPFAALLTGTLLLFPGLIDGWLASSFGSQAGTKESVFTFWTDTTGSLLSHLLGYDKPSWLFIAASISIATAIIVYLYKAKRLNELDILIIAIPLSSFTAPYGWMHDRVILTLLPLLYWNRIPVRTQSIVFPAIIVCTAVASQGILQSGQMGGAWWYPVCVLVCLIFCVKASRKDVLQ